MQRFGNVDAEAGIHVEDQHVGALAHMPGVPRRRVHDLLTLPQQGRPVDEHGLAHRILEALLRQEGLD